MSSRVTRIAVSAGAPYDVVVGTDVLDAAAAALGPGVHRVAVICPVALRDLAERIRGRLASAGYDAFLATTPNGEAAKTADNVATLWETLGRQGFTRSDAVVGVGGGATTDLAGFVAATFLRGIRLVLVPTSLLAMVDAAVGGKTGINTAEGKNLVGSFHEPAGVVCDLGLLAGLPRAELASGLAEVVKCGLIADPAILELVRQDLDGVLEPTSDTLRELIERAIRVKAAVVGADLRERTSAAEEVGREALNYGHTLAHAIERVEHFAFRHGEAVAIGLVYAAELGRLAGRLDDDDVALHRDLLRLVGLPTSYPADRWPGLRAAMSVDKKARGDRLRFVVLAGIGHPTILEAPDEDLLREAYAAVSS